jgi:hypothetical protein
MFNNLVNSLQKIKFEFSLWDLIFVILLAGILFLFVIGTRKLYFSAKAYSNELKEIDKRVLEHVTNIMEMIEQYKKNKDEIIENEIIENEIIEDKIPKTEELEIKKLEAKEIPKLKTNKTRSMSMEERWADFEKKRAMEKEVEQKKVKNKNKKRFFKGFRRSA